MKKVLIIGHVNPDTDSIVATMTYANLLDQDPETEVIPAIAGEPNRETKFVLEKWEAEAPKLFDDITNDYDQVVIVDHNESKQIHRSLDQYKITEVIDHHMIGDFKSKQPVHFRAEPLGSSSTLIYKMYKEQGIELDKKLAGLLLSGVLSDTLGFRSPTSTDYDEEVAKELAKKAEVEDLEAYAQEMFKEKSNLEGFSPEEIVKMDYKEFTMGSKMVGVGTLETTEPAFALDQKDDLIAAMKEEKESGEVELMFLFVVNILEEKSKMFVAGDEERALAEELFDAKEVDENILDTGPIISRKKQIVPPLTDKLSK